MIEQDGQKWPTMHGPARYRIRVLGQLDPRWADRLGGMHIDEQQTPDGEVETTLTGRLADQAALSGVFNALYELHLPVLSVEYLGKDATETTADS